MAMAAAVAVTPAIPPLSRVYRVATRPAEVETAEAWLLAAGQLEGGGAMPPQLARALLEAQMP